MAAYTRDFIGVMAEETYRQDVRSRGGTDAKFLRYTVTVHEKIKQ